MNQTDKDFLRAVMSALKFFCSFAAFPGGKSETPRPMTGGKGVDVCVSCRRHTTEGLGNRNPQQVCAFDLKG